MQLESGSAKPAALSDRVWTIPNLLSFARLAAIPLFVWLIVGPHADLLALVLLTAAAATDWLDGWLARRYSQVTRLGQLLDPVADRLYVFALLIALLIRDIVPWWLALALVARDAYLATFLPVLRYYGYRPLQVNMVGKAGTLCLLVSFPMLLLTGGLIDTGVLGTLTAAFAWAFVLWGLGLYWLSALLYTTQFVRLISAARRTHRAAHREESS